MESERWELWGRAELRRKMAEKRRGIRALSMTYHFGWISNPDLHSVKPEDVYSHGGLYDFLHPQVTVPVIAFDHVCDALTALHPQLDQLGKYLEDSLARACTLLFENNSLHLVNTLIACK